MLLVYFYLSNVVSGGGGSANLFKKVSGKKFLEKNLEIKTLEIKEKNPNFLKSLGKMSLDIKSCVLDSWDFFSYNSMGAAREKKS